MTQADKKLLLKDLCARLLYGVKINYNDKVYNFSGIHSSNMCVLSDNEDNAFTIPGVEYIKPYLFPLSSMTEEQIQEYTYIVNYISSDDTENWVEGEFIYVEQFTQLMYFYHINHLDYIGLIPMGLAIDATNKNIY